jgi:hypothetical protein
MPDSQIYRVKITTAMTAVAAMESAAPSERLLLDMGGFLVVSGRY